MNRLKQLKYHSKSQTVEVGPGLVWDEVYAGLEPYNVSVVGARATGVGVGGLLLGGGMNPSCITTLAKRWPRILIQDKPIRPSRGQYPGHGTCPSIRTSEGDYACL